MLSKLISNAFSGAAETPAAPEPEIAGDAAGMQRIHLDYARQQLQVVHQQMMYAGLARIETLLAAPALDDPKRLERSGWKAYSQNDEDGILNEIFSRIGAPHKSFVEFGSGDGTENNSIYLLAQGWRGLWIEGDPAHAQAIRRDYAPLLEAGVLRLANTFITRDNINELIAAAQLGPEIDLLSIDIDGNDYHVWQAINAVNARVVVLEYNAKFRPPLDWTMDYNPAHEWGGDDMMGASLCALTRLGESLGYRLAGCNVVGVNAFFVRRDLAGDKFAEPATAAHLYQQPRYHLGPCYKLERGHPGSARTVVQAALAARASNGA